MRLATTSMMLSFFLTAIDLNGLLQCGAMEMMRVPSLVGFLLFSTNTGMLFLTAGQDGGGVQHLGAEVGEFGRFFKADDFHAQGIGADARIGGHDAVDVGPDFDGIGGKRSTDKRTGEVGTAAAQGRRDARLV